ncbi:MAG TPA: hypothetical protein PKM88_09735 [bacterium]|nr:hypothetical protein [bacterium]
MNRRTVAIILLSILAIVFSCLEYVPLISGSYQLRNGCDFLTVSFLAVLVFIIGCAVDSMCVCIRKPDNQKDVHRLMFLMTIVAPLAISQQTYDISTSGAIPQRGIGAVTAGIGLVPLLFPLFAAYVLICWLLTRQAAKAIYPEKDNYGEGGKSNDDVV